MPSDAWLPRTTARPAVGSHWLASIGFVITHQPGVSRAWRLDLRDGYLLITDIGGYDLPEIGAPASAYAFSPHDDLLEFEEMLVDSRALHEWVQSARRRSRWRMDKIRRSPV